jgi:PAS domain-containing protein
VNAREVRAAVVLALADLYEDPLTRTQFKRFEFEPAEAPIAADVIRTLAAHLIVETKPSGVARLTELGYRILAPELQRLRAAAERGRLDTGEHPPPALPTPDEITRLERSLGRVDYLTTATFVQGRLVTDWADEGFERLTGYTVRSLEEAGGWPVVLRAAPEAELQRWFSQLLGGEPVSGELTLTRRDGRTVRVRFLTLPRWDAARTAVAGTVNAGRELTRER